MNMRQIKVQKESITNRCTMSVAFYLKAINHLKMISPEEEVELTQRIKKGDIEARNKLIEANLRFVITIAKQYLHSGLPLEDLINEGNIGLITAAEKFDETRGFKFISYAVWWIRQNIIQAIGQDGRQIRLPFNQQTLIQKINRVTDQFRQDEQRDPSVDELAEVLNESSDKIKRALHSNIGIASIDTPIGDDGDSTLQDILVSSNAPATDDNLEHESLHNDIADILKETLRTRDSEVLSMLFGLNGNTYSYNEVANRLNITSERVRQIKERALNKLRKSPNCRLLKAYL